MQEMINIQKTNLPAEILHHFPFDVIKMIGNDSVDFLQRITTNDFAKFIVGDIQKTLVISERGRMIDAVWVIHRNDHLLMLASEGMSSEIISWLNKYIIMEDIALQDVTSEFVVDVHFEKLENSFQTDYFGIPVSFELKEQSVVLAKLLSAESLEHWRIENRIPKVKKEIISDYNPLELNLWDFISFTKGCYIGQEVIARLDTYNKIQRTLSRISSSSSIKEQDILLDESGVEVGKITSVIQMENVFKGLAVVRIKFALERTSLQVKDSTSIITIEKVFQKENHERN